MSSTKRGLTIAEMIVTFALFGLLVVAVVKFRSNQQKEIQAEVARWRAHLTAESVSDAISSLDPADLYDLLLPLSPDSKKYRKLSTRASPPDWLKSWIGPGGVTDIEAMILLRDSTGAAINSLPSKQDLFRYTRDVLVTSEYKMLGQNNTRSVTYDKSLTLLKKHMLRSLGVNQSACALLLNGTLKCWDPSQNVDLLNFPSPNPRIGYGIVALATSNSHSCAGYESGDVQCWGDNSGGGLGISPTLLPNSPFPIKIPIGDPDFPAGTFVTSLAVGNQLSCVTVSLSSFVWCWGTNFNPGDPKPAKLKVGGVAIGGIAKVSAMKNGLILLALDGSVTRWDSTGILTPIAATQSEQIFSTSDSDHACLLSESGELSCFGINTFGQLGNGSAVSSLSTAVVVRDSTGPLGNITSAFVGTRHTCAQSDSLNKVWCWGDNSDKSLGQSAISTSNLALAVPNLGLGANVLVKRVVGQGSTACASLLLIDPIDPARNTFQSRCWGKWGEVRQVAQETLGL